MLESVRPVDGFLNLIKVDSLSQTCVLMAQSVNMETSVSITTTYFQLNTSVISESNNAPCIRSCHTENMCKSEVTSTDFSSIVLFLLNQYVARMLALT